MAIEKKIKLGIGAFFCGVAALSFGVSAQACPGGSAGHGAKAEHAHAAADTVEDTDAGANAAEKKDCAKCSSCKKRVRGKKKAAQAA